MTDKITLPNGARVIFEDMPSVRSAAVGFWVSSGARHEPEALGGISHAIEHMLFKGTQSRSAAQIASEMDAIGGQVNAFTTKECTCYYGRALGTHLDAAIELLSDLFFNPKLAQDDWQLERGVIAEEIGMYEDTPEDLVGEELFAAVYKGCPLGRPILGNRGTLDAMSAADIAAYKAGNYVPGRMVVSLAGCYTDADKQKLVDLLSSLRGETPPSPAAGTYSPAFTSRAKAIEQNHLCLGFPSLPLGDDRRYALQVLNGILGAGMSSRLFQNVREKNGLCYSVYSYTAAHADTGLFGVYTALNKETEAQALKLICQVIRQFTEQGPEQHELDRVREQIKANLLMSLESTSARMQHLGQHELLIGHVPGADEIIERYDAVTCDNVREMARLVFDFSRASFSAVGAVEGTDYRALVQ